MRGAWPFIIEYQEKPEDINLHILLEWLEGEGGRPVTWGHLVATLEAIGLDGLAREIQEAVTTTGTADEPPPRLPVSSATQETPTTTADKPSPTPAPGMSITIESTG